MTEPLPKWIMRRYSLLWNAFGDKEFSREDAFKAWNNDSMANVVLSALRRAGWLEVDFDPGDARKRVYRLKSPEESVREMKVNEASDNHV
ncbi:hypothetical protein HY991_05925 [Candidatus Micrarchaeota archaeon]|nr:hypothetical protein [Candidatus Micrarchaeota archaeon]